MRAERHANAELASALRHRVSDHTINSDCRQHHGDTGKRAEQHHVEARLRQSNSDQTLQRFQRWNVNVAINFLNGGPRRIVEPGELVTCRAQYHIQPAIRFLGEGKIKLRNWLDRERFMPRIADNTDDLRRAFLRSVSLLNNDVLAKRISSIKEFFKR